MLPDDPVALLVEAGYRRLSDPIRIEGVVLQFDDVLVGPGEERDLVLIERKQRSPSSVARLARALVSVLEARNSRRPVSLVLVLNDPAPAFHREFESIRQICPVYMLGPGTDIGRALRPLLPLRLPTRTPETRSADAVLTRILGSLASTQLVESLLAAAKDGSTAVEEVMLRAVDGVASLDSEDE